MDAVSVLELCQKNNIIISVQNGDLKIKGKKSALTSDIIELLRTHKSALITFLQLRAGQGESRVDKHIPIVDREEKLLASYAQRRLWFVDRLEENDSTEYNLALRFRFKGKLDVKAYRRALQEIVDRHEVLRTIIKECDGDVYQAIQSDVSVDVRETNLSELDVTKKMLAAKRLGDEEAKCPFDLQSDVLLRGHVYRLGEEDYGLLLTVHHIAADGWSLGLLFNELTLLYEAYSEGLESPLPPLKVQYADYAQWQRASLQSQYGQLAYWKEQLQDLPALHSLPLDYVRPAQQRFKGKTCGQAVNVDLVQRINQYCQKKQATLFMFLQSAFSVLLSRYSRETDIVIGSPIAGRDHSDIEPLIGLFVNTLVLRCDVSGNPKFSDLIEKNRQTIFQAYENQSIPFETLVEEIQPNRNLSHSPMFQIMLTLHNSERQGLQLKGLQEEPAISSGSGNGVKFDLELTAFDQQDHLYLEWTYSTDLFSSETIERMSANFLVLMEGIIKYPDARVAELPMLTPQEQRLLQKEWNDTGLAVQEVVSLVSLFESQVEVSPKAIAVCDKELSLSFRELNEASNRLANYLKEEGVIQATLVGLCMDRSVNMVIAMLGIMKAGGSYVPLDPQSPSVRLFHMIEDACLAIVISQKNCASLLPSSVQVVCLDEEIVVNDLSTYSAENGNYIESEFTACAIYTSGSTGQPKGVLLSHACIVNRLHWMQNTFPIEGDEVFVQKTALNFVDHVAEVFQPLTHGTQLVILSNDESKEISSLLQAINGHCITRITLVPSLLRLLAEYGRAKELASLRYIFSSGEKLSDALARQVKMLLPQVQLINLYGSTEVSADVTYAVYDDSNTELDSVSIGKPIANSEVYVLDSEQKLLPLGAKGELYVSGSCLAQGYLNRKKEQIEKFVSHVFKNGERMYRTGDIVRWLPQGELHYLGREDDQIKLRGMRLEAGEVEAQMRKLPQIQEVAVLLCAVRHASDKRLVAYILLQGGLTQGEHERKERKKTLEAGYRKALKEKLPEYMVPELYIFLERFPLTVTGKIDRKALPAPKESDLQQSTFVAPGNEVETLLCQLWREILHVEQVGIEDNFFSLGGDSILSIKMVALAGKAGLKVTVRDIFREKTIANLSKVISEHQIEQKKPTPYSLLKKSEDRLVQIGEYDDVYPLTISQMGTIVESEKNLGAYHNIFSFHVESTWNEERFVSALRGLIRIHPVLRSSFNFDFERPLQCVHKHIKTPLFVNDIADQSREQQQRYVGELIAQEKAKKFDLRNYPAFRIFITVTSENSFEYSIIFHHAIFDGWSASLFTSTLLKEYSVLNSGGVMQDLPVNWAFRDYVALEIDAEQDAKSIEYWENHLKGAPRYQLPRTPGKNSLSDADKVLGKYSKSLNDISSGLIKFSKGLGVPLQTLLLASHFKVLSFISGDPKATSMTGISARPESEDGTSALGLFVRAMPLCLEVKSSTWRELINNVESAYTSGLEHRYARTGKIQESSSEVIFNYTHFHAYNEIEEDKTRILESQFYAQTHYDFHISFYRDPKLDLLNLEIIFNSLLYDNFFVEKVISYYEIVLSLIISAVDASHDSVPILSQDEIYVQTKEWGVNPKAYPSDKCIHELFEESAMKHSGSICAESNDEVITYHEINRKSNQLARKLLKLAGGSSRLIAVLLDRSIESLIAFLAVLKSGSAYVPLDPNYPSARLRFILEDCGAKILIANYELLAKIDQQRLEHIVCLSSYSSWEDYEAYSGENINDVEISISPNDLAYVMYTSGTTGRPKGVLVEHKNVVSLVSDDNVVDMDHTSVVGHSSSISFDAATFEIWATLSRGARLVYISKEILLNTVALGALLKERKVQILFLTTSLFNKIAFEDPSSLSSLTFLLTGGEAANYDAIQKVLEHSESITAVNVYGPTETTTFATYAHFNRGYQSKNVSIGKPMANMEVYVLSNGEFVATGGVGELFIGGDGVSRGYLGDKELTEKKFSTVCNANLTERRLYATGDMVRWLPDGQLQYIERKDNQVKVRGFRIELSEIEHQLLTLEEIQESKVVVLSDENTEKKLVAYLVKCNKNPNTEVVSSVEKNLRKICRSYLLKNLPDYMVPSAYVIVDRLPLTENGKIDEAALPEPKDCDYYKENYEAPKHKLEKQLCKIWEDLLGLNKVGVKENFFDVGGNSLLIMQLQNKIASVTGYKASISDLFAFPTVLELTRHILGIDTNVVAKKIPQIYNNSPCEPIAIIGMAGRFPGAKNISEFWLKLETGTECLNHFSDEELIQSGISPSLMENEAYIKTGALLEEIDKFDPLYFGMTPREAQITDPQHRIILECAAETLESAGYGNYDTAQSIGAFISVGESQYAHQLYENDELMDAMGWMAIRNANSKDSAATRLSYKFNLTGPSLIVDTACSSSLVAVHEACKSLWLNESEMALAGGADISLLKPEGYMHVEGGVLSPDGHCRTFDRDAQGTRIGSGGGIVLLKRLSRAVEDGDTIHAVIKGSHINNDGAMKIGYTAPSHSGQKACVQAALAKANCTGDTIQYVETHGTGTKIGDPIEISALSGALKTDQKRSSPCLIGALKPNIGHLNSAAGVAGLIKTVESIKKAKIPPTINYSSPNPELDLNTVPFNVVTELLDWPTTSIPRRAGVSSFGIGGTNCHVVLEEAPVQKIDEHNQSAQIIMLSAQSEKALGNAKSDLANYLLKNPTQKLADVAYTLQIGRKHYEYRAYLVADNTSDAIHKLSGASDNWTSCYTGKQISPPVVFMFPGQGAQYAGMASELYKNFEVFRKYVDKCLSLIAPLVGFDLKTILFDLHKVNQECPGADKIFNTSVAQPALFVIEYALAKTMMSLGITPTAMIGHSLGEYVAACVAGVFSLEDALKIVVARGRLMQETPAGKMLSVVTNRSHAYALAERFDCDVAAINSASDFVVSGECDAIKRISNLLNEQGIDYTELKTSHAFHSRLMEPVLRDFESVFSTVELKSSKIDIVSNVSGELVGKEDMKSPSYWLHHLRNVVEFSKGLNHLSEKVDGIYMEVGPGSVLGSLVRKNDDEKQKKVIPLIQSFHRKKSDWTYFLEGLGKIYLCTIPLSWGKLYGESTTRRIPLPTYPFVKERYWVQKDTHADTGDRELVAVSDSLKPDISVSTENARNDQDVKMLGIWRNLLGRQDVKIEDNFFELGGDSLLLSRLVAKIRREFGKRASHLNLKIIFNNLCLHEMSDLISGSVDLEDALEIPDIHLDHSLVEEGEI